MASHHHHKVYFAPMMPVTPDLGLGFSDKRNRNPNWTDHEIMRFLDILQEEKVLKDLMAQRNKQVFCYVAQRMTAEGSEKTWDQCRIKLKNLKSQYRYVKDRIPNIDEVDLEDDDVLKQLIAECQGRGISPSNIKHLRYLKRFLQKTTDYAANSHFKPAANMEVSLSQMITDSKVNMSSVMGVASAASEAGSNSNFTSLSQMITDSKLNMSSVMGVASAASEAGSNSNFTSASPRQTSVRSPFFSRNNETEGADDLVIDDGESVSPPSTPLSSGVRLIMPELDNNREDVDEEDNKRLSNSGGSGGPSSNKKRRKLSNSSQYDGDFSGLLTGSLVDGCRFIEKFNRDMMDQFLDYQRRVVASQIRWEQERYRQEQLAMEQWRTEARDHEKQMFGIFCGVLSQCNAALNILLKTKLDPSEDSLRPNQNQNQNHHTTTPVSINSTSKNNGERHHQKRQNNISSPQSGGEDKSSNSSSGQEHSN